MRLCARARRVMGGNVQSGCSFSSLNGNSQNNTQCREARRKKMAATVPPVTRQITKDSHRKKTENPPVDLQEAQDCLIYDRHGVSIPFKSLYQDRKVIIVFVRVGKNCCCSFLFCEKLFQAGWTWIRLENLTMLRTSYPGLEKKKPLLKPWSPAFLMSCIPAELLMLQLQGVCRRFK